VPLDFNIHQHATNSRTIAERPSTWKKRCILRALFFLESGR
jgi:uncharacterized protein YaeQ